MNALINQVTMYNISTIPPISNHEYHRGRTFLHIQPPHFLKASFSSHRLLRLLEFHLWTNFLGIKLWDRVTPLHEHKRLVSVKAAIPKMAPFGTAEIGTKHHRVRVRVLVKAVLTPPTPFGTPEHWTQSKLLLARTHRLRETAVTLRDRHCNGVHSI